MILPQKWFREHALLNARAKVNLRLKITGRRTDGYHLLSMINVSCALADTIQLQLREDGQISVTMECSDLPTRPSDLPAEDQNLAARAVREFSRLFCPGLGARIEIRKQIPLGGGLGGGSGNAAAVLAFLAHESGILSDPLKTELFWKLGLSLGADVPFMIDGRTALVQGIGEKLHPLDVPGLDGYPMFLVFPPFGIETGRIFARRREAHGDSFDVDPSVNGLIGVPVSMNDLFNKIDNDLLPAAVHCEPRLAAILDLLRRQGGCRVSMSGSGSTLFVIPDHPHQAADMASGLEDRARQSGSRVTQTSFSCVPGREF